MDCTSTLPGHLTYRRTIDTVEVAIVELTTKDIMSIQQSRFGYHFAILHRLITALNKKEIEKLGIHASQIPFMVELLKKKVPVTQEELAITLVIDKSSTARALSQLEKNGFVNRKNNPDNRRQNLVTATSKARKIEKQFFKILQGNSDTLTQGFSKQEIEEVKQLLSRMIANASSTLP